MSEPSTNAFLLDIQQRLLNIAVAAHSDSSLHKYYAMPQNITNFPSVMCSPQQFLGLSGQASELHMEIPFNLTFFYGLYDPTKTLEGEWRPLVFVSNFLIELAARPNLQYSSDGTTPDTGLKYIGGNVSAQLISDLSTPFPYPQVIEGAPWYWGAVIRVTVPYHRNIDIKVAGL